MNLNVNFNPASESDAPHVEETNPHREKRTTGRSVAAMRMAVNTESDNYLDEEIAILYTEPSNFSLELEDGTVLPKTDVAYHILEAGVPVAKDGKPVLFKDSILTERVLCHSGVAIATFREGKNRAGTTGMYLFKVRSSKSGEQAAAADARKAELRYKAELAKEFALTLSF